MAQSPPETFSEFAARLFEMTAADPRCWIASAAVDSTSSQARRFLERSRSAGLSPVAPCCFVAWSQSSGRGRGDRSWQSPPGLGLYMTFVLPGVAAAKVQQMPMVVAMIVARALDRDELEPRIKWPNDIEVNGRKLAGVLLEASSRGTEGSDVLVGIGINVHHTRETLPFARATSLALEGAHGTGMAPLAVEVGRGMSAFENEVVAMVEVVDEYRAWTRHALGDRMRCRRAGGFVEGDFAGFDGEGSLLLRSAGQLLKLSSGEIVEG